MNLCQIRSAFEILTETEETSKPETQTTVWPGFRFTGDLRPGIVVKFTIFNPSLFSVVLDISKICKVIVG